MRSISSRSRSLVDFSYLAVCLRVTPMDPEFTHILQLLPLEGKCKCDSAASSLLTGHATVLCNTLAKHTRHTTLDKTVYMKSPFTAGERYREAPSDLWSLMINPWSVGPTNLLLRIHTPRPFSTLAQALGDRILASDIRISGQDPLSTAALPQSKDMNHSNTGHESRPLALCGAQNTHKTTRTTFLTSLILPPTEAIIRAVNPPHRTTAPNTGLRNKSLTALKNAPTKTNSTVQRNTSPDLLPSL